MVSKTPATAAVATSNHCVDDVVPRKEHDKPLFIPPRKRQVSKKTNGAQNYVDHIVNVQNRQKLSPSNAAAGLEDDLLKTSLILKNKQPLPAIPTEAANSNELTCSQHHEKTSASQSADSMACTEEDNEMRTLDLTHCSTKYSGQRQHESSTVTPSSYSESSLDMKLGNCLLSHRSSSKKRVNIRTDLTLTSHSQRNSPEIANFDLESGETSVLNVDDDHSLERYHTRRTLESGSTSTNYLTMTGTIKRGRKKGECMDLQINMSREELERINAAAMAAVDVKKSSNFCCRCTWTAGVHIFLMSLVCLPFVMIVSAIYSFYIGTLTWYNIFNFFNEEKSCIYRFFMSPILILAYPVVIILCTVGLGIYAGIAQLSFEFYTWLNEIADIEKGFYGWLCSFLHLSDCSPYEVVVILTDIRLPQVEPPRLHVHTSTEELSL